MDWGFVSKLSKRLDHRFGSVALPEHFRHRKSVDRLGSIQSFDSL